MQIMKKLLFIIIALFVAVAANAQEKVYCELVGVQGLFTKKFNISVDFGQESKLFSNEALVDEKGKAISFNTMVDAMNYMSKHGWEFEQAYIVTIGTDSTASHYYHWVLSKVIDENGDTDPMKTVQMVKDSAKAESPE